MKAKSVIEIQQTAKIIKWYKNICNKYYNCNLKTNIKTIFIKRQVVVQNQK